MGNNLFMVIFGALIFLVFIDIFDFWYRKFLRNYGIPPHIRKTIAQAKWVILALLFWNSLYRYFLPEAFDFGYMMFALFLFSLRGLVVETFRKDD